MTRTPKCTFALSAILSILVCAGTIYAQGSRKDDVVFNAQGRPMAGATVRVCTSSATGQPCSPLAPIYSDGALTQALANPLSADGMGNYTFYAAPGRYEIEISGPGITTKQMPNVILPSDPSTPTFTTVTTTSGISAFSLSLAGNLTVSGSVAIDGTLTVGGVPVVGGSGGGGASTSTDNQWTADQRFKGPIPWRDFTAYMPAGGCSSLDANDPNTTGSISSGSSTLTVANARDFKNGCGITVLHAGPTASIVVPPGGTASAARSGNVVTLTFGAPQGLWVGMDAGNQNQPVAVSGCSDSSFDGWFGISGIPTALTVTYNQTGAGATATGCTVTFMVGWAQGVQGSTAYYYKISACDANGGCSAASPAVEITNGNATLTPDNFNWIGWNFIYSAKLACVYRSPDNVTYTAIGTSLTTGYTDRGLTNPVFPGCPSTPPSSPTAQQLTTTIASGGGTTTLTLATIASRTATAQNVYHDETPFLAACAAAVATDQFYGQAGSHGCLIPAGEYQFNSDAVTDWATPAGGGLAIYVDGSIRLNTWPWIMGSLTSMQGMGWSGGSVSGTPGIPTTTVDTGRNVADVFALEGSAENLHGFSLFNIYGNGIWVGVPIGNTGAASHPSVGEMNIANTESNTSTITGGVPIVIDGNVIFGTFENLALEPNMHGIPATVHFTNNIFRGITWADFKFENLNTTWHDAYFDCPGGTGQNSGGQILFDNWMSEERGQYATGGIITWDTGGPVGGTCLLPPITITAFDDADVGGSIPPGAIYVKGTNTVADTNPIHIENKEGQYVGQIVSCSATGAMCAWGWQPNVDAIGNQLEGAASNSAHYFGVDLNRGYRFPYAQLYIPWDGLYNNSPQTPVWADVIPGPQSITATVGSGGLAAGQWCVVVVGVGINGGATLPSPEICKTVSASGGISLSWPLPSGSSWQGAQYADWYVYYGSTPGGETNYVDTGIGPVFTGAESFNFTSVSVHTPGNPPTTPTAYLSWLNRAGWSYSCLLCDGGSTNMQLGIGEPRAPAGDKLAVKGGVLDAESGFKSALSTKSSAYTLAASDYWVNVTGTTTITVPHATTGNHWVVFNSGSSTVTVQADSGNINGGANITLSANTGKEIACDGTNCFAH